MSEKPFIIPQSIRPLAQTVIQKKAEVGKGKSFEQILQQELAQTDGIKFSRHALERLNARSIKVDQKYISRLNEAVEKAQAKGARESLILLDELAFVVSIKNKTVITAVDGENRKDNVFTNIDSAVIN